MKLLPNNSNVNFKFVKRNKPYIKLTAVGGAELFRNFAFDFRFFLKIHLQYPRYQDLLTTVCEHARLLSKLKRLYDIVERCHVFNLRAAEKGTFLQKR